ncbi:TetR/AcrR family transcriptional regulator [Gryllotalpicola protaetiae]|uniref:TetR family transcriptional regulator n=1 Tax=Gryllotalpicola protaetiae TaxID=2419771 RepID=A0A387BFH2_9MICO|nr:TetR family transcriptional regulator [Gryllotalpicola protaetiae]AYG02755.1 TetR family transcriptional regulator [Gryllotalpicola protaetiae]
MTATARPAGARAAGLTRDQIIDAAIELLDDSGDAGLTFRALALKLHTGHGAIQWHVTNKSELLVAATVATLTRALTEPVPDASPREIIRAIGLGVFTAIEAHPWLGSQLFATPWQSAMVQLWEQIGRPVEALGVPSDALFTAVSTLVNYIVGVGSQNAVNTHILAAGADRETFLNTVADRWESFDLREGSLISRLAAQLRVHGDREEFLAGIDIILAGLEATYRPA